MCLGSSVCVWGGLHAVGRTGVFRGVFMYLGVCVHLGDRHVLGALCVYMWGI